MGENEDPKQNPPAGEVISPEPAAQGARPRKDPPVLDGEAEVLSEKTKAQNDEKPQTATNTKNSDQTQTSMRSPSFIPVALASGIAGALAVGAAGYFLGFGRVSLETQDQVIALLETRVSQLGEQSGASLNALQAQINEAATRLKATEEELQRQAQSPENIAAIRNELQTLSASSTTLSASLEQLSKSDTDTKARIANLETTLTAINMAMSALGPRLDETIARLTALEEKAKNPDAAGRAALGLALANLARASEGGSSFKTELDVIANILPDEPDLAKLATAAEKGAPSVALLKEQFPDMAQSVFDAERRGDAHSLWSKLWGNAKSIITIRRTGEVAGDDTEAVIARMEERLKGGDLAAAVAQGRLLKGVAADTAKPWLERAQARVDLDRLIRSLSARVASRLAKE